jgi:dihydroxyacid dehydratase/phosphogluconate dehydratase
MYMKQATLNKYSRTITQPKSQGASQAMLYATGLEPEDMNKAQVGEQQTNLSLEEWITLHMASPV